MASLDTLPADQRAVLSLVLQRGRGYGEIAELLSIDRAAVRQRALAAFDALGPPTTADAQSRALITDYLLDQLPVRVASTVRDRLAVNATERAWARVLAAELAPLASHGLPQIPPAAPQRSAAPEDRGREHEIAAQERQGSAPAERVRAWAGSDPAAEPELPRSHRTERRREQAPDAKRSAADARRSSRTGGALVLVGIAALIAVVVVVILLAAGGSSPSSSSTTSASAPPAGVSGANGATPGGSSATARPVAQVNLSSPSGNSKIAGIAQVVRQGAQEGIVIAAAGVPANTKRDAYAVWLYRAPGKGKLLGFVNPGVGKNGRLSTAGALPGDASIYNEVLVTLETQASPKAPGRILLQGSLRLG